VHERVQHPVLITGLSGLLGSNLARLCAAAAIPVAGIVHRRTSSIPGVCQMTADLCAANYKLKLEARSGWVIHCAAATDLDWCEQNEAGALAINVEATRRLAAQATRSGWRFLYISTDSVFHGARGQYREEDVPAPLNVYARSKLAGEKAALAEAPDALIIRSNFYGQNGGANLAEWLLNRLSAGARVNGFDDVIFSPLFVNDLAALLLKLAAGGQSGLFHLGASNHCSKYDFAVKIARAFQLDTSLVARSSIESCAHVAKRPLNTSLDIRKAVRALGCNLPTVDEGIRTFRSTAVLV
jgi:dTDP-4-dehydrorhamnose reductase